MNVPNVAVLLARVRERIFLSKMSEMETDEEEGKMHFDLSGASYHVGEPPQTTPLFTYGGGSGSGGQQQDWLEAAREQERKRFAKRTRGGDEPQEEDERQSKRSRAEDLESTEQEIKSWSYEQLLRRMLNVNESMARPDLTQLFLDEFKAKQAHITAAILEEIKDWPTEKIIQFVDEDFLTGPFTLSTGDTLDFQDPLTQQAFRQALQLRADQVTLDDEKKRFIAEIKWMPLGITRTGGLEGKRDTIDELASSAGRTAYLRRHGYFHLTQGEARLLRQLRERIQEWSGLIQGFTEYEHESQKRDFLAMLRTWPRDGSANIDVPNLLEEKGLSRLTFTEVLTWPEYQEWRRVHYMALGKMHLRHFGHILDHWPPEPDDIVEVRNMGRNAFSEEDAKQLILETRQSLGLTSTVATQPIRGDARVPEPGSSTMGIGGRFHAHRC